MESVRELCAAGTDWQADLTCSVEVASVGVHCSLRLSLPPRARPQHSENPLFGHYSNRAGPGGQFFGVFLTPLGGVTDGTSAASYGSGPLQQGLAVHQVGGCG